MQQNTASSCFTLFHIILTFQPANSLVSPYWYQQKHTNLLNQTITATENNNNNNNNEEDDNFQRYRRQSFLKVERLRESGNSLVSDIFSPYNYSKVNKM